MMTDKFILDEQGEPVMEPDLMKWARWYEGAGRHVGNTTIDEGIWVSTVFLGMDHNFSKHGPPVLWETMVFGGPLDGEQERYCTRAEALAGHAEMVERCKAYGVAR